MAIFGSSGIRGRYPSEVNETLFLELGAALGSLYEAVVVGRDVRASGVPLAQALAAGATSRGAEVHDAGLVTTPTLGHLAARFDSGAMVTASHNRPEYNGLKLWLPSGMAFDENRRATFEAAMATSAAPVNWKDVGSIYPHPGGLREHQEKILSAVESAETHVVLDCGNGSTSLLTPELLRRLGCDVDCLNCQPDGAFPGRGAEPTEEALTDLSRRVRGSEASLGIAHDGDGDRMVALDEEGRMVKPEKLLILFARAIGARRVVAPVDSSMILEDVLGKDAVIRSRVGDVYVAETLAQEGADLAGETSSTWIFPDFALCPDGPYAAARLCVMLQDGPLGEQLEGLPDYPLRRGTVAYDPADRDLTPLQEAMEAVDASEVNRLDGWRFSFDDAWAIVRASGTEPVIRLTVEARDEARTTEIYEALRAKVSEAVA
ncbi:MAG: phosphopentomutase/phosphoglucosamine mutase [Candidatus Thermoplasmatota archaeon]|nr:phosphopentomutase/phosphoglucosamine mutase [Candidatus Thermoplasmatota archaeon]